MNRWLRIPHLSFLPLYFHLSFIVRPSSNTCWRLMRTSLLDLNGVMILRGKNVLGISSLYLKCLILLNVKPSQFSKNFSIKPKGNITQWWQHKKFYFQTVVQPLFSSKGSSKDIIRPPANSCTLYFYFIFKNCLSSMFPEFKLLTLSPSPSLFSSPSPLLAETLA